MKKTFFTLSSITLLCFIQSRAQAQDLKSVTTNGNTTDKLIRIEGSDKIPATGSGLELYYMSNQGYLQSRNRDGNVNTVLNLAGSIINTTDRTLIKSAPDDGTTVLQVNGGVKTYGTNYRAFSANILNGYGTIDLSENNQRRAFMGYNAGYNAYATFGVVDDGGAERGIFIQRVSGNVGIGTSTPQAKLAVDGNVFTNGQMKTSGSNYRAFTADITGGFGTIDISENSKRRAFIGYITNDSYATFGVVDDNGTERGIYLQRATGNVGIGTTNPQARLAVNGDMFAKRVKVTVTGWPDYVFQDNYQLPSLKSTELYIKEHKHLPEIPSAQEVSKDGIDVGEMNKKLLQKIEELTLHLIRQQKEIDELSKWKEKMENK
ncbi:MAG TPA: hypothetical protein VM802_11285 [Chitinophaga sp.]|uniref:hypothetical protein n=1 Tax=Chitinophaga sp. TaxID=1869181 RepID=UPI002D19953A|nr:hypothetical protein [Chitinophaga sp.]HVI45448.1 hypothetical protein [Chitinophaga sp.]